MIQLQKEFKNQDIYIVGSTYQTNRDWERDVEITDDETNFVVKHGINLIGMCSDGYISILSEKDFRENLESLTESAIDGDVILVKNFTGLISIGICDEKGNDVDGEINIDDYIHHQKIFREIIDKFPRNSFGVCVYVDAEYSIKEFNIEDAEEILTARNRDNQIDEILKDDTNLK